MARKPTYEELEQRIKELEKEAAERKRAEEALLNESLFIETTLNTMQDAFIVFDLEGRIIRWNKAINTITGYSDDELSSMSAIDCFHEEDKQRAVEGMQTALKKKLVRLEARFLTKDGKHIPFDLVGALLRDRNGNPIGICGAGRDITERKQAEELLRKAEQEKSAILDSMTEHIVYHDTEHKVLWANRAAGESVDLAPEKLVGRRCYEIWQQRTKPCLGCPVEKAIKSGQPQETEMTTPDGRVWFIRGSPIRDANGNITGGVETTLEITERIRAQEALQESELKYRSLADSIADVFFAMDGDLKYTYWNKASEDLTGISAKDAIGKQIFEIFPDNEETKRAVSVYQEVLRTQQSRGFVNEYRLGDKRYFFDIRAYPSPNGLSVFVRDVTVRKRAEDALRESEEKYRNIVERANDGIAIVQDTLIKYINPRLVEIAGYTVAEVTGTPFTDYIYPDELPTVVDYYNRLIAGEEDRSTYETALRHRNGSRIEVELNTSMITYQGKPAEFAIIRDLTERNRLEAQLHQAQKLEAMGTLAGGIAHNFNNLLMAIMGNASVMLLETDPTDSNYARLKSIEKSLQNGSQLTSQLLGYARKGGYEVRPVSLNQLVKETSDTFEMTKKEIRVHRELAQDLFGIKADQEQIEQTLLNLYVNAADAMPGGGDLFLKTLNTTHKDMRDRPYKVTPGNYVLLTVRDTGVGMEKKTIERIFDPFFTTKAMGMGTGLGLASVYGIIKSHGGYIDVESQEGHGTTFRIYLPASEKKVRGEKEKAAEVLMGRGTILLVDDEDMVLNACKRMLNALGYEVLLARSGREAIELYKANKDKVDLVLLDMVMPEMGGGETYDQMKEINPNIKVLLSSGYSINGQATDILDRGCDAFIQKPFSMSDVSQKIREVLEKK